MMYRRSFLVLGTLAALSACAAPTTTAPRLAADGKPLPKVYRMGPDAEIEYRMLDSINALRNAAGLVPLQLNAQLEAAAATHAGDMARQNRPWHFGSDGSSPIDRIQRVGYTGHLVGENISESYETELETLAAWMEEETTRNVVMNPAARDLGFAWYQEPNGKIWWTMTTGAPNAGAPAMAWAN